MKKNLLLTLVALLCVVYAQAYNYFRSEGICYVITSETTIAVTELGINEEKYSGTIIIPAEVSYSGIRYSVTSIEEYAFDGCTGLTSITIPNSVTSIGDMAFRNCTGLTSITIPNSVTSIGDWAFGNTPWYNNQPDGVVYINNVLYAYKGAMPDNTSIVVKEGTVSISPCAFYNCTGLTSITIPNSVTSIGRSAFGSCTGLTSITIPNSVTSIGDMAFRNCTGLTSITIPNSVTSIGKYAFSFCTGLTSITIPNSVTWIGSSAFNNVPNIVYYGTATGSPWGARSINGYVDGYLVYEDATKTKLLACSTAVTGEITILNSVTSIGYLAFRDCTGLTSIVVESGNTMYDSRNNCNAIIETATNTLIQGCKTTIIPNSVTSIGSSAFYGCTGLTSVTIPNSVTSIGDWAFHGCTGLASVTIPNSVTSIGVDAFSFCTGLASVTIPNSVTSIGVDAFSFCTGLTSVTIPNSVTSIGWGAFSGCTGLTSVTIPNSVTSIGDEAFSGCTGLTSITIPNSVTSIGRSAFGSCTGLISITIPNSVTSIGYLAFRGCTGLTSITSLAPIPPTTSKDAFMYVLTDIPVYVPCGSSDAYSMAEEWKSFTNYIEQLTAIVAITSQDENKGMVTITKQPSCEDNICTFVATPKENYRFVQWSDGNTDNPRTITVTEDITLTANFEDTSATNVLQTADNQFVTPQKIIHNGQVYILRNGKTYTTTGVEIK